MKKYFPFSVILIIFISCTRPALVLQTDFGTRDGAVAEMKGVALSVDPSLQLFDITHEIPTFNIWEAAYRLNQAAPYWPEGTVFVSVIDPGVGTDRRSVVLKTRSGHYFVSPDNGTLTLVAQTLGIKEVRIIDEKKNRREGSEGSNTFHGRDVFVYTAARLASGKVEFKKIGKKLTEPLVTIDYQQARLENNSIKGNIPVLDIQYGNVWTNIPESMVYKAGFTYGDSLSVEFFKKDSFVLHDKILLAKTFGAVKEGNSLAYFNSLMNLSFAVNLGSFSEKHKVYSGPEWSLKVTKAN